MMTKSQTKVNGKMETKDKSVVESDDPLWLDIKKGLDAAVAGKMKRWVPRTKGATERAS